VCGQKNNRAWVDDCTLKNAAVVRDILESSVGKKTGAVFAQKRFLINSGNSID